LDDVVTDYIYNIYIKQAESGNIELRRIFGPARNEVTGEKKKTA
jgi:hypothetical protein